MSVHFDITLGQIGSTIIKVNIIGLNGNVDDEKNALFLLYAYDKNSGEKVFKGSLGILELRALHKYLSGFSIIKDNASKSLPFREVNEEISEILDSIQHVDINKQKKWFLQLKDNDKISMLLDVLSDEEIKEIEASRKQKMYKESLDDLRKMIFLDIKDPSTFLEQVKKDERLSKYYVGQPELVFQSWLKSNLWVWGGEYYKLHEARNISISSQCDIIIENIDGFIDLIELKRPSAQILQYDQSHKSYYPSVATSKVIGQSLHYLKELDIFKSELQEQYKVKVLTPRVFVVTGSTKNEFNSDQKDKQTAALRMLNSNLNHIKIVSYDYLLNMGQKVIDYYSSESETDDVVEDEE